MKECCEIVLYNRHAFEALYHICEQNCIKEQVNFNDVVELAIRIINNHYEIDLDPQTTLKVNQILFNTHSNKGYDAIEQELCKSLAGLELTRDNYDVYFDIIDSNKNFWYLVPTNSNKLITEWVYNYKKQKLMKLEHSLLKENVIMLEKISKDKIDLQNIEDLIDPEIKV